MCDSTELGMHRSALEDTCGVSMFSLLTVPYVAHCPARPKAQPEPLATLSIDISSMGQIFRNIVTLGVLTLGVL